MNRTVLDWKACQDEPPRLLDRLRAACHLRHYSPRTEEAYTHWVRRFILRRKKALARDADLDVFWFSYGFFRGERGLEERDLPAGWGEIESAWLSLRTRRANLPFLAYIRKGALPFSSEL